MTMTCENDNMEARIIKAATTVFIKNGYAETSMSEIAVEAGINRPGLHYYFRTKEKMFQAVFGDIVLAIVPRVFEILAQKQKPIDVRIEELVDAYYRLFADNPRLPMFVIREMNRDASLLIDTAKQLNLQQLLGNALSSLQEEMDEGKLKNVPFRFLFYSFYGLLTVPFLTQDMSSIFLEDKETFDEMLLKWRPYMTAQLKGILM